MKDCDLDNIYSYIDFCFRYSKFFLADAILFQVVLYIEVFDLDEILAYLTTTLPAKSKLGNRNALYQRAIAIYYDDYKKGVFAGLE